MKCNKPITTLVHKHEQQTIKVKHKSKVREMQTQDNAKMYNRKGNRKTRKDLVRLNQLVAGAWRAQVH